MNIQKQISLLIDNEGDSLADIADVFLCDQFNLASPLDKPKVDQAIIASVEAAQERLNELLAMTPEEIEKTTNEFNETITEFNSNVDNDFAKKRNKSVQELCEQIENLQEWNWEDEKVVVKYFLQDLGFYISQFQLVNSEQLLQPMKPQEWYAQAIQDASNHLQRQIDQYQHEVKSLKQTEETIKAIRELFV
jgi:hypothetical protein